MFCHLNFLFLGLISVLILSLWFIKFLSCSLLVVWVASDLHVTDCLAFTGEKRRFGFWLGCGH